LTISIILGNQAIEFAKLRKRRISQPLASVVGDKFLEPLSQFTCLSGYFIKRCGRCLLLQSLGCFHWNHIGLHQPVEQVSAIAQPLNPGSPRRANAVEKVERAVFREKERVWSAGPCHFDLP